MDTTQAVHGAEFGLNLLRLSRALTEETAGEETRLSTLVQEVHVKVARSAPPT